MTNSWTIRTVPPNTSVKSATSINFLEYHIAVPVGNAYIRWITTAYGHKPALALATRNRSIYSVCTWPWGLCSSGTLLLEYWKKEKSPFLIWLSLALLFYGCSLDFLHCLWEWWLWLCSALTRWWSLQISERWTAWRAVRFARSLFCPLKTTLKEYYPTNQDKPLRQRRNLKHQRHIWKRLVVVVGPDPSPSREWPLPIKDGSPPRQVIAHEIHKHVWDRAAILQIYELLIRTDKYSLHW